MQAAMAKCRPLLRWFGLSVVLSLALTLVAAAPALSQESSGVAYSRVVDNSSDRFSASANWSYSNWNDERYGVNYRYATPNTSFSDPAAYRFDIPETGQYTVYAWWPSANGYNTATPIGVKTTEGWQWVTVDQSQEGGQWVELGTFNMAAGDEWNVVVSRWSGAEGYVIADAIEIIQER